MIQQKQNDQVMSNILLLGVLLVGTDKIVTMNKAAKMLKFWE